LGRTLQILGVFSLVVTIGAVVFLTFTDREMILPTLLNGLGTALVNLLVGYSLLRLNEGR
jgi:hypothetical protein